MIRFLYNLLPNRLKRALISLLKQQVREQLIDIEIQLSLLQLKGVLPPVPPEVLRRRIVGGVYGGFFLHGNAFIDSLETIARAHRKELTHAKSILDFGAGCGRVLIPLSYRVNPAYLSGCDIDSEAIDWLRRSYPAFNCIVCNPHWPPTEFRDNQFELIYSISVITHLPEAMQFAWLDELYRITQPDGLVLISFLKATKFVQPTDPIQQRVKEDGYYYDASSRGITDGLPEFYQDAYYTDAYIRNRWSTRFEVVDIVDNGFDQQDVVVLRKRL